MIEPSEIKDWLKAQGKDRYWLAEELGVAKVTIDGWLSTGRAIPPDSTKALQRLMEPGVPITPHLDFATHGILMSKARRLNMGYEKFIETVLIREAARPDSETLALYGGATPSPKKRSGAKSK